MSEEGREVSEEGREVKGRGKEWCLSSRASGKGKWRGRDTGRYCKLGDRKHTHTYYISYSDSWPMEYQHLKYSFYYMEMSGNLVAMGPSKLFVVGYW